MSEFGRVIVTTKLGQLSIMTDFQSEQLDYDRSEGDRARDLKHRNTLTIPPLVLQNVHCFITNSWILLWGILYQFFQHPSDVNINKVKSNIEKINFIFVTRHLRANLNIKTAIR